MDYVHVSELNLGMRFNSQKAVFLIVYSEHISKIFKLASHNVNNVTNVFNALWAWP